MNYLHQLFRRLSPVVLIGIAIAVAPTKANAQRKYEPTDPIASINGEAIFLGELNLILHDQIGIKDLSQATTQVQQAAAIMLVRRHLAILSLKKQGGEALRGLVSQRIGSFEAELKRRGSTLEKHAKQRDSDPRSMEADLTWQIAWSQYLKSRLTEKTLRSFFAKEYEKYAGGRWEVSQIFLEVDRKDGTSVGVAESRMEDIVIQLRDADDLEVAFAAAAKDNSDAGSADTGGKVGWVEGNGDLPSSVMNAVRTTKPGEFSGPIKSPLGLHLVLVHKFERKDMKFEDIKDQAALRRDATNALFGLLVKQQKDAKVKWFIGALRPPDNVKVIPD